MRKAERNALITLPTIILLGLLVAAAGSRGTVTVLGVPLFAFAVGLAFVVQWVAFIPAYLLQTEIFFDLTGSLTYIGVTVTALLLTPHADGRSGLLAALVIIWAVRLGTFLFRRVLAAGKDGRFDEIKRSFLRFLNAWTLQGLWVSLTLAAALAAITSPVRREVGVTGIAGFLIWLFGFLVEVVADRQKSRFRAEPANRDDFIRSGLWAWSRHPNYFGEIALWSGVALIALPVLGDRPWLALVSPLFVAVLLTRISGIPILEKRAEAKWGGQEAYEAYKERTPVLIPWPGGRRQQGQRRRGR